MPQRRAIEASRMEIPLKCLLVWSSYRKALLFDSIRISAIFNCKLSILGIPLNELQRREGGLSVWTQQEITLLQELLV
jgi:hypothetical protein